MEKFLILGAGVAGQTAALHARKRLSPKHEVVVVSPNSKWNWIPSNIWVGVGFMTPEEVTFPLAPVYDKTGICFYQAKAVSIHPDGDLNSSQPYVMIEQTDVMKKGVSEKVTYD
jgi:sulfide:quinone oxidoreductase